MASPSGPGGYSSYKPSEHITPSGHATPRTAAPAGSALEDFVHDLDRPVIAVDMDDVLSQTNLAVAQCEYSLVVLPNGWILGGFEER